MVISKNKIFVFLIAILYSVVFYIGYISYLNPWFDYAGFNIIDERMDNKLLLFTSILIASFPTLYYTGIKNISSFLSIFIYYFLYVPIIITFFFDLEGTTLDLLIQQLMFMVGMCLFFLVDRIKFKRFSGLPSSISPFKIVFYSTILSSIYMLIRYAGNLHFVSFEDVYDLRSANDLLGADVFTSYISAFLTNALIPICLAFGLFLKKKHYFILGLCSSVLIYMASGSKSVLFFPIISYSLFRLLNGRNLNLSLLWIGVMVIILMITTLLSGFNVFSSLFWMRTIGNSGSLTSKYHEFFIDNPSTYYTHINIVNFITNSYPYKDSIGKVIGSYYYSDLTNANANFWATDGYAALGEYGILFANILMVFVLIFFNRIGVRYNKLFLILCLIPYIISLLNGSLFSSLLTGGSLLVFIILSFKHKYRELDI